MPIYTLVFPNLFKILKQHKRSPSGNMAARTLKLFLAEVPGIAFLNIIFAVFQLAMVAYSLGQSAAVMVVNSALENAAERDGYSNNILFTGPFFAKDGSYANGFSCAAYLIIGSIIHLGIGLLLLAGRSTQKKSATLCLVWYTFTLMFLIGHMTFTTVKMLHAPTDSLPTKWNDNEIMAEVAFTLLVILEGLQIWIVYEFAREMKYLTDSDPEDPVCAVPAPTDQSRSSITESEAFQQCPPRYSQVTAEENSAVFKNVILN